MSKFIFLNGLHVGDIVVNKPFIKEIMKQIPDNEFYYAHFQNDFITSDICPFIHPDNIILPRTGEFIERYDNTTVINTWFSDITQKDNIKVLSTSTNTFEICHFEQLIEIYLQLLKPLNIDISYMKNNPENFIWEIENKYINGILSVKEGFKVLIYTNKSLSGQADNSDPINYIEELSNKYSNITFYVTDSSISKPNVVCLNNYFTQRGLDLFQFAELSKKCNMIVGNSNGTLMFTWLKSNLMDKNKIFIITHRHSSGECQFTSKQLNKTICTRSTKEMFDTLNKELKIAIRGTNGIQ
jgi:hypothetical protein